MIKLDLSRVHRMPPQIERLGAMNEFVATWSEEYEIADPPYTNNWVKSPTPIRIGLLASGVMLFLLPEYPNSDRRKWTFIARLSDPGLDFVVRNHGS